LRIPEANSSTELQSEFWHRSSPRPRRRQIQQQLDRNAKGLFSAANIARVLQMGTLTVTARQPEPLRPGLNSPSQVFRLFKGGTDRGHNLGHFPPRLKFGGGIRCRIHVAFAKPWLRPLYLSQKLQYGNNLISKVKRSSSSVRCRCCLLAHRILDETANSRPI